MSFLLVKTEGKIFGNYENNQKNDGFIYSV
jgi:hypothetical protein